MSESNITITIAPGLELVVGPDAAGVSERQIERARLLFDRKRLIDGIRFVVDHLHAAGDDAATHLRVILEMVGWISNRRDNDISMLASSIMALVEEVIVEDLTRLGDVLEIAELEMHKWWGRRALAEGVVEVRDQAVAGELDTQAVAS
jgi:hypothetical protein